MVGDVDQMRFPAMNDDLLGEKKQAGLIFYKECPGVWCRSKVGKGKFITNSLGCPVVKDALLFFVDFCLVRCKLMGTARGTT